jgi:hypothetical protein
MTKQKSRSKAGSDDEVATQEQELAEYLQERIKPGLNRGSIPLLARSIAKEIVERQHLDDASDDDEADDAGEADEQPTAEADHPPRDGQQIHTHVAHRRTREHSDRQLCRYRQRCG